MNLKDFLNLAGQQGKVVVIDEDGNVKGVFLSFDEYQKISGNKSYDQQQEDIAEKANREILQAQLEEVIAASDGGTAVNLPERIDSVLSKRAQELFKSIPFDEPGMQPTLNSPHRDYRTPEVATTSDEEISTNFDDI